MHRNSGPEKPTTEMPSWKSGQREAQHDRHLQLYETDKSPMFAQPQELFVCSLTPPNSVKLCSS